MIYLVRMWSWVRSWFTFSRVSSKLSGLELKVTKLRRQKDVSDRKLQFHLMESKKWQQEIEKAAELNKRMNLALDVALQEIENIKEITIPGLVASHRVLISRWEAEIQVHAIRSANLQVGEEIPRE